MNKVKSSNIELLRIIAMVMIIAHHYCLHGVFSFWHTNSNLICYINNILLSIISMGGKIGVDIFVLITGYFMITKNFNFSKVIKLYLKTLVYSLLILGIAYIYGEHHVPSNILNSSLFPFGGNAYWFITAYIMLYILTPYLNRFILTSKKTMLNLLMITTTIFWVIIPTFTYADYCFSNLIWFIYLYFVGAAIRLKTFANIFIDKKLFKFLSVLSCIFLLGYVIVICSDKEVNLWNTIKPAGMQTIFILSIAVFMFNLFKDLQINYNKFINFISASVLGVYLFHDNNIVRPFLWQVVVRPYEYMYKPYMILYLASIVLIIFLFGIIIDKFIMLTFDKLINKIITKFQDIIFPKRRTFYKLYLKVAHKINR